LHSIITDENKTASHRQIFFSDIYDISSELAFWPWMALYICATGMARKCDAFGIPLQGFEPGNDRFYRQLLKIEELPSCEGSSE